MKSNFSHTGHWKRLDIRLGYDLQIAINSYTWQQLINTLVVN